MPAGYWGPPTASTNFCERDYFHSHYVAELANTLSSVPIALVGVAGLVLCRRQRLHRTQAAAYAAIATVGVGSVAFHATLLRTGQVLDELPMLWGVLSLICVVVETADARAAARGAPPRRGAAAHRLMRAALGAYSLTSACLYFAAGFALFIAMYAFSVLALVLLALASLFRSPAPAAQLPKRLLVAAAFTYAGGFLLLWLPGELLCHSLPIMERLPMHALFHLTSAAGPHLGLTAFALARYEHENPTAPPSRLFAGLPAIERGAALIDKVA
ncbi:hypothetical protein AB1Y20_003864 [Prymnesium parvum]|uniref:Alkaline ceramidase n=1 Tax=Prymnesium parvum TaxID=97485 RepID=A0AB34J530_PRYPA